MRKPSSVSTNKMMGIGAIIMECMQVGLLLIESPPPSVCLCCEFNKFWKILANFAVGILRQQGQKENITPCKK